MDDNFSHNEMFQHLQTISSYVKTVNAKILQLNNKFCADVLLLPCCENNFIFFFLFGKRNCFRYRAEYNECMVREREREKEIGHMHHVSQFSTLFYTFVFVETKRRPKKIPLSKKKVFFCVNLVENANTNQLPISVLHVLH